MSNDRSQDPFRDLVPFVLTAERGSFREAATQLGVTPSAVSRAVARLEGGLGIRLLKRTSRSVALTPEGRAFLDSGREAMTLMEGAAASVRALHAAPTGRLGVGLPLGLGRALLPGWSRFIEAHPELRVEVRFSDAVADLQAEGIDVAVRVGPLPDSSLVAHRLGEMRFVTVAAPSYFETAGRPARPEDLPQHRCLGFRRVSGRSRVWRFIENGRTTVPRISFSLLLDDGGALVELVRRGLGIAQVPDVYVAQDLASGALTEILPGPPLSAGVIYAVRPEGLPTAAVRAFIEAMKDGGGEPESP